MNSLLQRLQQLDWWLLGAITLLMVLSDIILFGIDESTFQKQLVFSILGLGLIVGFGFVNYRYAQNYAYLFYVGGAVLLLAVLLFGTTVHGTTGWFQVGPFSVQPVEIIKIIIIITLARFFSDYLFQFDRWKTIGIAMAIIIPYGVLVMLQPDLGSMMIFVAAFVVMLLLTNVKPSQLALMAGATAVVLLLAWMVGFQDYQKNRILTFVDPARDPLGTGYNVTQSIISVGSGGWFGRGLGLGTQSQLEFLPERQTDFIFAVIGEELGFIGAAGCIVLLGIILWRIWLVMQHSREAFVRYYSAGLGLVIFVQLLINIGMNMGLMPVTGIPLPFVSSGGSSLLALCVGVGIVMNCRAQQTRTIT